MDYVTLKNNIRVSRLCFGTLTMAAQQCNLPPEEGAKLLLHAFERGVNFLDTAQYYQNYEHIGLALKQWQGEDIVVSTKTYAYTRELAQEAVEEARTKLNRDVIDIFMLHEQESIHTLRGHKEALDYLMECREKGIIRAVGVSMHHVAAVEGVLQTPGIDVIHPLLNVGGVGIPDGTREQMQEVVKEAHDCGISVVSMKPFGGGNLFRRAAECLTFLFEQPYIDAIALGMQSLDEVDANIGFFETGRFSPEAEAALSRKKRHLSIADWCEGCGACMTKCASGALSLVDKKVQVDPEKCVLCGYCAPMCKQACIKVL